MDLKILTLIIITSLSATATQKVIYGEDNRLDVYEVNNSMYRKLAKSTAGMVNLQSMRYNMFNATYKVDSYVNLRQAYNLCSSENFIEQKLTASCSGFLIAEDILVTAGHCMAPKSEAENPCKENAWVFDLHMKSPTEMNLNKIPRKNVYRCKQLLAGALNKDYDFAVIKLDRKVKEREPLKFRQSGKISNSTELLVIGHPSGLPTKIARGGTILNNTGKTKFLTSLDTFHGNSGSGVFNAKTGVLEGILVAGKTDYTLSRPFDEDSCRVVNQCSQAGKSCSFKPKEDKPELDGEVVVRITSIFK